MDAEALTGSPGVAEARTDFLGTLRSQITAALIDGTRNNPFLYFRATETTRFVTPPIGSPCIQTLLSGNIVRRPLFGEEASPHGGPIADEPVSEKYAPGRPNARRATRPPRAADPLMRRLRAIHQKAKEFEEERGVHTLFLALGMLSWPSDDGGRAARAPIVLLPVRIVEDPHIRGDLAVRRADEGEPDCR
jgi:hypothetical protein